ncbi:hypothetical protein EOK75_17280 (plasmid) [Pseudorhodobacter turbinis]|uniref:Uncharacterized protein n=1 Tax=Pseudorhodobacter turbinis TaxID=2500533 RepID=A0A4P8EK79_9RHOB|nr:hypothetical protein [Pseudorhodobacter turbinis]QCO57466.1 hypothetical protein EOK75_17280 [Pseudorhodobacter turbinis]
MKTFFRVMDSMPRHNIGNKVAVVIYAVIEGNSLDYKVGLFKRGSMPTSHDTIYFGSFLKPTAEKKKKEIEALMDRDDYRTMLLLDYKIYQPNLAAAKDILVEIGVGLEC